MSIKDTLPDMRYATSYSTRQYAAAILYRIGDAMWVYDVPARGDDEARTQQVSQALALTRQWRKTLPHQGKRSEMYGRFTQRDLLRIAARHIITADDIAEHSSEPHPTARPLRYAEAALRTWLKGQQP